MRCVAAGAQCSLESAQGQSHLSPAERYVRLTPNGPLAGENKNRQIKANIFNDINDNGCGKANLKANFSGQSQFVRRLALARF